jgi:hypothetical protein
MRRICQQASEMDATPLQQRLRRYFDEEPSKFIQQMAKLETEYLTHRDDYLA